MSICQYCNAPCIKKGFQKNGTQKFYCRACAKYQQGEYQNKACMARINEWIKTLVKEGCGIRSIARILKISITTVIKRIKAIAASIVKPMVRMERSYEMDEMRTIVRNKANPYWIAYAIDNEDRTVVDFKAGARTKQTLNRVIDTLLLSKTKKIYTDGLKLYQFLIPKDIHKKGAHRINHIERMNLNIRTHLKRLSRKTICFSKKAGMLEACLKIYFWG